MFLEYNYELETSLVLFFSFLFFFNIISFIFYAINKNKANITNNKYLLNYRLITNFILTVSISISSVAIAIENIIPAIIGFGVGLLYIVSLIYESIKYKKIFVVRSIVSLVMIIMCLISFINNPDVIIDLSVTSMMFVMYFFIVNIVLMFRLKQNDVVNENDIITKGYYSIGCLSRKSDVIGKIVIFLGAIILFAIAILSANSIIEFYYVIIGLVVYIVLIFTYSINNNLKLNSFYNNYTKNLDYDTFKNEFLNYFNHEKIHPETKNLLLMKFLLVARVVSNDDYEEYSKHLFEPKFKAYKIQYDLRNINIFVDRKEFNKNVEEFRLKYPKNKNVVDNFVKVYEAYTTGNIEGSIDILCSTTTENKFVNASNLFIKCVYYLNKDLTTKAEECYNEFINSYSCLYEFKKILDSKFNKEEE